MHIYQKLEVKVNIMADNIEKKDNLCISIITVVYNGESYLEQTILSVINQNYNNVEYIIIDGGSTDGTVDIIKKYESKISYWVSEKDNGIYNAMNKGIKKVTGDLIGIINADDFYAENIFSDIVDKFISSKCSILYSDGYFIKNDNTKMLSLSNINLLSFKMSIFHPSVFIKREIYEKYGFFNENFTLSSDYELLLRCKFNNVKFLKLDKIISNMRLGGSSSNYKVTIKETLLIQKMYFGKVIPLILYFFRLIKYILKKV